ncbi:MAG: GntR family transcriptional regulator [Cellvibrionaceae bacterium]|nr:GntR family transcriptional regulator [Cellvibrionaceae bacterium]
MNDSTIEQESALSRVELAYRKLKNNILSNEYPPGYQALEPELAKTLGVSRTPVREALIRLEAEKLIELIPRRGMRVLPLVPADILEISQILTALEVMAVELLGKKKPGVDMLRPMADAVDEMDRAIENDDLDAWSDAEEKFHRLLLTLSGNKRLAMLAATVRAQAFRARKITLKLRPKSSLIAISPREVFEALRVGDWQKAKDMHYSHRMKVSETLIEVLDQYQLPHL